MACTPNPGVDDERRFIHAVYRVYSNKNNLNSFKGYVTFRCNEVKYKKKTQALPDFSSIELRDSNFNSFVSNQKYHFYPAKIPAGSPVLTKADTLVQIYTGLHTGNPGYEDEFKQRVGELMLYEFYPALIKLIDGQL